MSDPSSQQERPVELPPEGPGSAPLWILLLSGPIIWISHFALVYLAAEAACAAAETEPMWFLPEGALVGAVVVATVVAATGSLAASVYSWRRSRSTSGDDSQIAVAGTLLALGSCAAILAVGLPALALTPC